MVVEWTVYDEYGNGYYSCQLWGTTEEMRP